MACGSNTQTLPSSGLVVDGLEREYFLYVPQSATEAPMPLLIAFHGGGGIGSTFPQQAEFEALAESEGFIMAFPQGYAFPGNEGEWQLNTRPDARHDINFINAMIDEVSQSHSIDASRVYATGYSLGSMFVYEVACQMSDKIAAVASHAGTMPVNPADCEPENSASILHIHGVDDGIIAYGNTWDWKAWDEVGTMRDIPALVDHWQEKYACQDSEVIDTASGTHLVHEGCEGGARVEHHRLGGVGHEWPDAIDGVSTHQVIWSFVSGFSL
jgi:polyhydroxybutyrate depolymerase